MNPRRPTSGRVLAAVSAGHIGTVSGQAPGGSKSRVLHVKWLPPIADNPDDVEDLPATIHKVEGTRLPT